jgi:hypothetical protein
MKLFFYEGLDPDQRQEVKEWHAKHREDPGDLPPFGVVTEDDALVALDIEFQVVSRHKIRQYYGEEAWRACKMPGLFKTERRSRGCGGCGGGEAARIKVQAAHQQGIVEKAGKFFKALTGGKTTEEEFKQRHATCLRNRCGFLKQEGDKVYCGACGCPKWKLAELSTKLWFKELECPVGLWGKSNGK